MCRFVRFRLGLSLFPGAENHCCCRHKVLSVGHATAAVAAGWWEGDKKEARRKKKWALQYNYRASFEPTTPIQASETSALKITIAETGPGNTG